MQLSLTICRHVLCQLLLLGLCRSMIEENLFLPEGSTWKVGVFHDDDNLPSAGSPQGSFFVFDEKCNVTIVFHEVYQELKVALCRQADQMRANLRALLPTNRFFSDHCTSINPHRSPVIRNYEGPILLAVWTSRTVHIKDRSHLRGDSALTFNATYELRLKSMAGMGPHIDPSTVEKHAPCETNGVPVLVPRNESFYEYVCDCQYSTYGPNCEWGPLCPRNRQRELCSFHGSCKQRGDVRTCICDSEEYHGSNCIHFTFFQFRNCCQGRNGGCCHNLPTMTKCSCANGFKLSAIGKCVKDLNNRHQQKYYRRSIIQSIISSQKNEVLEMCCSSCQENVNFTFYKDNHTINDVPVSKSSRSNNLVVWKRGDVEINTLGNGNTFDTTMCLWIRNYSDDDFGLYSCNVQNGTVNETKKHYVLNKRKYMELNPQRLTVFKGDDVKLKCRVYGAPFFEYGFNFNWTVSPRLYYQSMTVEPYFFQGSNILIKNIQENLNIECYANGEVKSDFASDSFLQSTQVKVIKEGDKYCEKEVFDQISWQLTLAEEIQQNRCPIFYNGTCTRKCYKNKNGTALWDLPDCSDCQNAELTDIFKDIRMYKKGIESYGKNSLEVLSRVLEYLTSKQTFLHGELGYVAKWIQNAMSVPHFICSFKTFSEVLSLFTQNKHSLRDQDMYRMEDIIGKSGELWKDETCKQTYYNDTNIISLLANPFEGLRNQFTFTLKLSPQMSDWRHSKCVNVPAEEVSVDVDLAPGIDAAVLGLTVFKKPFNLIPFLKRVYNESWDYPSIGNASSALMQIEAFAANRTKISSDQILLTMRFSSCRMDGMSYRKTSAWTVGCARYLPRYGFWNASGCKMKMLEDGSCSCNCKGTQGWLGLVCYKEENFTKSASRGTNTGTVLACGMSFVLLSITTACLLYKLSIKRRDCFSRLVEVLSVLIVDAIFIYQSLAEPRLNDNLVMLIIISSFLVLALGVSVSHHVSTMQKCSLHDPLLQEATKPSFLVVIISILASAMLGVILWTVSKVQDTKLTKSWLPNTDASILTMVVLCYIYALIFMLFSIAALNYLRIRRLSNVAPKELNDEIRVEFRNKCIINLLHLAYIFSSFYQEGDIGCWIFGLSVATQSVILFLFYSSEKCWEGNFTIPKRGLCLTTRTESKSLRFSLYNCWKQIFTPYSGVARCDEVEKCDSTPSNQNSISFDNVDEIPSTSTEESTKRKVSQKLNGGRCDCTIEKILVHRDTSILDDNYYKYNSNNYVAAGPRYLCMDQYELQNLPAGEILHKNSSFPEYHNCNIGGISSLGRNSGRKDPVDGMAISSEQRFDKPLLKISPSVVSRNPNLAYFSVKNKGFISRFSSKFSLSGGKGKLLSKMNDSCWPIASLESFSSNHIFHPASDDKFHESPKHLSLKNKHGIHRRQHSL